MKRRSFIGILGALASIPLLGVTTQAASVKPQRVPIYAKGQKERALFKRFFEVANGFPANEWQRTWFLRYQKGEHIFEGPRQQGMTTFMITLALFETKCNSKPVAFFAQNNRMTELCKARMKESEYRLGNFTNDIVWNPAQGHSIYGSASVVFVSNDAKQLPSRWNPKISPKNDQVFFFGTGEALSYKGKSCYDARYLYAPYIPLYTTPLPI